MNGRNHCNPRIMGPIRKVWSHNLQQELAILDSYLDGFPVVSIDTEFPGFIRNTPWGATEEKFYEDLRFNVNQMKLIQLGLTVSDDSGNIGVTWEFNFGDFDPQNDIHSAASVSFLKNNGFDFQKLKKDGIAMKDFSPKIFPMFHKSRISRWVTFHGLYDTAYLLKAIAIVDLPNSTEVFAHLVEHLLGNVSDLKHMARYCQGLEDGKLGLEKLARLLDMERIGNKHQAGSDSLLTASLYAKMKQQFQLDSDVCEGYLYGLRNRIHSTRSSVNLDIGSALSQWQIYCRLFSCGFPVYYQPYYFVYF